MRQSTPPKEACAASSLRQAASLGANQTYERSHSPASRDPPSRRLLARGMHTPKTIGVHEKLPHACQRLGSEGPPTARARNPSAGALGGGTSQQGCNGEAARHAAGASRGAQAGAGSSARPLGQLLDPVEGAHPHCPGLPGAGPAAGSYSGFRNAAGEREGYGVLRSGDGTVYTGQWASGRRHGHGTLFFSGGVFEGQWVRGQSQGRGTVHFKNGDTFEGSYTANRKCGAGTYRWADGAVESGEYAEGDKHGLHVWRKGGDMWELQYERGAVAAARRTVDACASNASRAPSKDGFGLDDLDRKAELPRPPPKQHGRVEPKQSNGSFRAGAPIVMLPPAPPEAKDLRSTESLAAAARAQPARRLSTPSLHEGSGAASACSRTRTPSPSSAVSEKLSEL